MRPLLQAEGRSAAGAVLPRQRPACGGCCASAAAAGLRRVRQACSSGRLTQLAGPYCAAGMDSSGSLLKYSSRAVR